MCAIRVGILKNGRIYFPRNKSLDNFIVKVSLVHSLLRTGNQYGAKRSLRPHQSSVYLVRNLFSLNGCNCVHGIFPFGLVFGYKEGFIGQGIMSLITKVAPMVHEGITRLRHLRSGQKTKRRSIDWIGLGNEPMLK